MPSPSFIRSFVAVLSAVGYATAQVPLGVEMVPNPDAPSNSPAPSYPSDSGSSWSSSLPVETGTPAYGAPPSQHTPPPAESSSVYQPMPYSSFTGGGYSQMDCGYGFKKGHDGKCTPESWVRPSFPTVVLLAIRLGNKLTGYCGVFADRACLFFSVERQLGLLSDNDHH